MARLAASTGDPAAVLGELLDIAVNAFSAQAGSIALLSPDTGNLETVVQTGLPEGQAYHNLPPAQGITGWCVFNRRPLLLPDVAAEPRYIPVRKNARCEMAAPMRDGDHIVGVIDLESDRVHGFKPADLAFLEQLADEAARVLQRLWQLQHLHGKARQLESLITAGQSLVSKLEQQALFETLAREARDMMQARACAMYVHDPGAATVQLVALVSSADSAIPTRSVPLDSSLVASAIHTRRQVAFADVQSPEFRELMDLPNDPTLVSLLATPLIFEGGVLGVLAIFTDRIHRFDNDEKRLCAALASLGAVALQNARLYARAFQSEDILRKNERLTTLGLLAAEIAHEIRNPLTVLKLLHGGLGLDFPADDPRSTDMRVIGEKLDQLEAIVTRVLNFAQAPSSLHARSSLGDMVEDTLVLVRLKLAQSKVTLRFEPPPRPLFVDAHKGQLQQVLLNLLINATHAMPDGGTITIRAGSESRPGGTVALLDLTDTGGGVPEAIRTRMFDSFLSGRPDGTGLGLAIAKRILLSHHGDIALLQSGPAGTTMRITLPLAK
ncbi:MAG: GAF domain-containing protein [Opitutus sp.]